ncbi:MAG: hypothetical protein WC449_05820 [Candidatus Paceibacterota bacterium]
MKKTIAVYKNVQWNLEIILEFDASRDTDEQYARISEPQEVDFVPREESEVIASQLKALDAAEESITQEALEAIKAIQQRKQELIAITHQSGDE